MKNDMSEEKRSKKKSVLFMDSELQISENKMKEACLFNGESPKTAINLVNRPVKKEINSQINRNSRRISHFVR